PHARAGQMALRDLTQQSVVDRDERRAPVRRRDGRSREGEDADRLFRDESVGHRRNPSWCARYVAPSRSLAPPRGSRQPRRVGAGYKVSQVHGVAPFDSGDPDSARIWWSEVGVHQNLTFPVQPDPVSGMHCWHQRVTLEKAGADDRYGDIFVDTEKAHAVY